MTLSKREEEYIRFLLTRDLHGDRTPPLGIGPATILSCVAKKLVCMGANGYYPTALGRFVGTPLEWREYEHGWTVDFMGGSAFIQPGTRAGEEFRWHACLRYHNAPDYMIAPTRDSARAACEAWVRAERLRQAGEGA